MSNLFRTVYMLPALVLVACGEDGGQTSAPAPAASAPPAAVSAPAPAAAATAPAPGGGATRYIDHSVDEMEFMLKRSKAGFEALLEDYEKAGTDGSGLKADIAAIEAQLEKLSRP